MRCDSIRAALLLVSISVLLLTVTACSALKNTLAQELAFERWQVCSGKVPDVALKEIRPDGEIWFLYSSPTGLTAMQQCLRTAASEQGKRGVAPPPISAKPSSAPAIASSASDVPAWQPGSEWAFRYDMPSGAGTFTWVVDRIEQLSSIPHYVVTSGRREIFFRVADLAITQETVGGVVVRQTSPLAWPFLAFPLAVGRQWDMKFTEARPVERQTEDIERRCAIEAEEDVTVPAGTFRTFRATCHNAKNGAWVLTLWYAPVVKQFVREESAVLGGRRLRELLTYRLR